MAQTAFDPQRFQGRGRTRPQAVGEGVQRLKKWAGPAREVWNCVEAKVGEDGSHISPEQFRAEVWMSIINGSRGLLYFGGHIGKACMPEDARLGWNWTFWNRVLRPVIEEIGEKSPLCPALVAPNSKLRIQCGSEGMEFVVREVGDEVFILACKREGATIQAKFSGLPVEMNTGDVLYESPRKVEVKNGQFTDWFGPFEVHAYRFRR